MNEHEKARKQREHISRLVLGITHVIGEAYLKDEYPGRSADLILLAMAVKVGQSQERLLTPAKAAIYAGIPRATAIRKLETLKKRGLVGEAGGGLVIPRVLMETEKIYKATQRLVQMIHQASAALSKLDA